MRSALKRAPDGRAYDLDGGAMAQDMDTASVTVDPFAMSATCVFSTGALDRVGDVVEVAGIRTANHERNPVVFWNHGRPLTLPIGKARDLDGNYTVSIGADVATQTTFFSQTLLEAEQIFRLIEEGIVGANSIGFDKIAVQPIYVGGRKGLHILECDLLEISWVGVPVNQEAVRKSLDSLVCGKPLAAAIREALTPYAARSSAWANGVTLKCFDSRAVMLKAFEESKHPRASDGRFGDKPGQHEGGADDAEQSGNYLSDAEFEKRRKIQDIVADLSESNHSGLAVPLDEFRQAVAEQMGEGAPSREEIDKTLRKMRDDGQIRLIALGDPEGWTDERLEATIPGDGETFAYVEPIIEQPDEDEPEDEDEPDEGEDLHEKWDDEHAATQLINDTEQITPENVERWNEELDTVGSQYRLYLNPDGETVANLTKEEEGIVNGLEDFRPTSIAAANAELADHGDWRVSWGSTVNPQLVHVDEYADDLQNNGEAVVKGIKKLDDIHAFNDELIKEELTERAVYDGMQLKFEDNDIDDDSLRIINDYGVKGARTADGMMAANAAIEKAGGDYRVIPDGEFYVKILSVDEIPEYIDERPIGAYGILHLINDAPEAERAQIATQLDEFLESVGSVTRFEPDIDEAGNPDGSYIPFNLDMLQDPEAVAEYIVDNWDIDEGTPARVAWFNNLIERDAGGTERLRLAVDESGESVIEVYDMEDDAPGKGLRFWSWKGRWITIGGSEEGGEGSGGAHVYIDESGRIAAGPEKLEGKRFPI